MTLEEQCTYVCRSKTPWIPWNTDTEAMTLTRDGLPVGESSVRMLHVPAGQNNALTYDDIKVVYEGSSTGSTAVTGPTQAPL